MTDQFFSHPLTLQRLHFGPLGDHMDTFAQVLSARGYTRSSAREKIRAVAGLSRWLHKRGLGVEALDEQSVSAFSGTGVDGGYPAAALPTRWKRCSEHLRDGALRP